MSYGAPTSAPTGGGFRLEVTRLGWGLMAFYTSLWLLLFGLTHWVPQASWMPRVDVELPAETLVFEEASEGAVVVRSLATEEVTLRGPDGGALQGADGEPVTLRGGERLELALGDDAAEGLSAWVSFGIAELWRALPLVPLGTTGGLRAEPWQVVTGPLFYPPVGGFPALMLSFLGFVFFAAPVERMLGRRSFLQLWLVASLGAAIFGVLLSALLPSPVVYGFAPAVFAVMVVHCMMTPEGSVPFHLIFTVLHVRMKWIAAAIAALVVLRTLGLVGGGPSGAYSLAGLVTGYLWWRGGGDLNPRRMILRRRARANLRVAVDRALDGSDDEPVFH